MYTPETVFIHDGINYVLNDKTQSNTENLLNDIKYMTDKCCKLDVKNISISGLVFTTNVSLKVFEKFKKNSTICSGYGLIYIDNRTITGVNFCQDNSIYYNQMKRFN